MTSELDLIVDLSEAELIEMNDGDGLSQTDKTTPFTFTATPRPSAPPPTSSGDSSSSSSSDPDSDSDSGGKWKRARTTTKPKHRPSTDQAMVHSFRDPRPVRPPPPVAAGGLPRKYNVWSNVLLEQTMVTGLNTVGVRHGNTNNDRQSESYDYSVKYDLERGSGGGGSRPKQNREYPANAAEIHRRYGLKRSARERLGPLPALERSRRAFEIDENDPVEKIVTGIATILREPKTELIERVVKTLGKKKSLDLLSMTEDIEESGGLMIMNGSRRRTPGGVYLFLLRKDDDISQTEKEAIFEEDKRADNSKKKEILKARTRRVATTIEDTSNEGAGTPKTDNLPELPGLPELLLRARHESDKIAEQEMECSTVSGLAEETCADANSEQTMECVTASSEPVEREDGELSD